MPRQEDLRLKLIDASYCGVEVVDLEPQQHTISVRTIVGVADREVVMSHVEPVQLKNELPVHDQPLVLVAAVRALAVEKTPIPAPAGFDVSYCDERLRPHVSLHA